MTENIKITPLIDHVADALDDLAALGAHWTKNRDRGRTPHGIKKAMVLVARDVLLIAQYDEHVAALVQSQPTQSSEKP